MWWNYGPFNLLCKSLKPTCLNFGLLNSCEILCFDCLHIFLFFCCCCKCLGQCVYIHRWMLEELWYIAQVFWNLTLLEKCFCLKTHIFHSIMAISPLWDCVFVKENWALRKCSPKWIHLKIVFLHCRADCENWGFWKQWCYVKRYVYLCDTQYQ